MSKLVSQPLDSFLDKLGSSDAAPGGGAAAAVVIAQAAALAEMVARLNLRRSQKNGLKNAQSAKTIALVSAVRREALSLLQEDVRCFLSLSKFGKNDRDKPAYLKAVERAADVPYRMCLLAQNGIRFASSEITRSSSWIYSDLLESAVLFDAGFRSARLNVEINLACLKKSGFTLKMRSGLDSAGNAVKKNYDAIFKGKQ